MKTRRGFTLFEVLIALLILVVTLTVSLGGLAEALRFSGKMNERTEAMAQAQSLLFQLYSGLRQDLLYYGGREKMGNVLMEIDSSGLTPREGSEKGEESLASSYQKVRARVLFHKGKDSLEVDTVLGGPIP